MERTYRVVSDYGFGDVTWLYRDLTAERAAVEWKDLTGRTISVEDVIAMAKYSPDSHPIYRIEEDSDEDEHPDTFLES
jgi:hypothetical protein